MSKPAIRVENLGKKYILRHQQEGRQYKALRDVLVDRVQSVFRPAVRSQQVASHQEEFWALKDVEFEIQQGDRVGIIGRNGAGKSTLLKVLSRITQQTTGKIQLRGRVASLLEVGTGFHPELTGRENIYLNGSVLGMKKAEIRKKFDQIVDFAEVERFLDTPVKRYSSGMYVRLAFAVAAHLEPEILIVDEVLAVGDAQFQKKCLGKMEDVSKREGRTVLFVSHNMAAIRSLCFTGIVLQQGKVIHRGDIKSCIQYYEEGNAQHQTNIWARSNHYPNNSLVVTQVESCLQGQQPALTLELDILLQSNSMHKPAHVVIDITDLTGTAIMQAIPTSDNYIQAQSAQHQVKISISLPPMIPGQYLVSVWVGHHNTETLDWVKEVIKFEVFESPILGRTYPHTPDHGYIVPPSRVMVSDRLLSSSAVLECSNL
jgi:lipopolysaccharide transport system ATP-binding protein